MGRTGTAVSTTTIEWTDTTWNPTTGCDQVSPGCDHCYALTLARRLKGMGSAKYQRDGDPETSGPGFGLTMHPDVLAAPLSWRKPRMVFVNSMSDLFHKDVEPDFIARAFAIMALTPHHTYQLLTKRHARMRSLLSEDWFREAVFTFADEYANAGDYRWRDGFYSFAYPLPNVWLGVSVEDQKWADIRIPALLETPAAVRFISAEPLLGPIRLRPNPKVWGECLDFDGDYWHTPPVGEGPHLAGGCPECRTVDQVIVGGESGPGARPMDADWVRNLQWWTKVFGAAFFFKQWGGIRPKSGGRELDGRTWDEMPGGAT